VLGREDQIFELLNCSVSLWEESGSLGHALFVLAVPLIHGEGIRLPLGLGVGFRV
jgi:hypothetical protein